MNTQEEVERITKESIDQEMLEKAMVDEKILNILDHVQLVLIVILVVVMLYITYRKVVDYLKKKRKEQEDFLAEQQHNLEKDYYEKHKDEE